MRASAILALIAFVASGAASADELFAPGGESARIAALYVEVPLGARNRQRAKPGFGLRLQEARLPRASAVGSPLGLGPRTVLDVPLRARKNDALRDSGAAMLLGKGAIVGIVVGAVVAVSVIGDDDGDGGGY